MKKQANCIFLSISLSLLAAALVAGAVFYVVPAIRYAAAHKYDNLKGLYADEKAPREPLTCDPLPEEGTELFRIAALKGTGDPFERDDNRIAVIGSSEEVARIMAKSKRAASPTLAEFRKQCEQGKPDETTLVRVADIAVEVEILGVAEVISITKVRPNDDALKQGGFRTTSIIRNGASSKAIMLWPAAG